MSRPADDLDERIRSTLRQVPVGDDDAATVIPAARSRARVRRDRRRAAAAVSAVVAVAALAIPLADRTGGKTVVADSVPDATTTSHPVGHRAPPVEPLADGPLPELPRTELVERDGYVYWVESRPGSLSIGETSSGGGGSAWSFDPESTPSPAVSEAGWSSDAPDRKRVVFGVTRAEVARVEWMRPTGTLGADTFGHAALPQLRFFLIEDPEQVIEDPMDDLSTDSPSAGRPGHLHVVAYGADGAVLADTDQVDPEDHEALHRQVDRRRGVEDVGASLRGVRIEEGVIFLEIFDCGGDPRLDIDRTDDAIAVSATVQRPIGEGPCRSGATRELEIEFAGPVGDRRIIDGRTGEPVPVVGG